MVRHYPYGLLAVAFVIAAVLPSVTTAVGLVVAGGVFAWTYRKDEELARLGAVTAEQATRIKTLEEAQVETAKAVLGVGGLRDQLAALRTQINMGSAFPIKR